MNGGFARELWLGLPLQLAGAHFPPGEPLEQRALELRLWVRGSIRQAVRGEPLWCVGDVEAEGLCRTPARGRVRIFLFDERPVQCELRGSGPTGQAFSLEVADRSAGVVALTRFRGRIHSAGATRQVELRADWRQLGSMMRQLTIERRRPDREPTLP